PLWLGSLKSNIGHAQAAAGVAGVIKMVMAMRHGVLPKTLHVDEPSSKVDWSAGAVDLLVQSRPWPETGRSRRAGVSSFGVSGTNAHVVLEHVAEPDPVPESSVPESVVLGEGSGGVVALVVSGCGVEAARAQAARVASFIDEHPEVGVADVGWSLVSTRAVLADRAVVVATDREGAVAGLGALARGEVAPGVVSGSVLRDGGGVGVMFSGQGSQYSGMGQQLHRAYPVFAEAFDYACAGVDAQLVGQVEWSVRDVVFGSAPAGLVDETVFTQAGLFALEVGVYRLRESWGVRADVVMGHSVGEVVAAHVSGVLSLADACVLVAARGRLMQALPRGGRMVAVAASPEEVSLLVERCGGRVVIAAVNSPCSVVVSGDDQAVDTVVRECARRGWRTRGLRVSHAFHSPCMDGMIEEFQDVVRELTFGTARIPVISNVTGEVVNETVLGDPGYWGEHARQTVRFADGVRCARAMGIRTFVEVGPGGVLANLVQECREHDRDHAEEVTTLPGLHQGAEITGTLTTTAELFVHGLPINWTAVINRGQRIELPTYAFQHQHYWLDAPHPTENTSSSLFEVELAESGPTKESLVRRLAGLSEADQERVLLDLVRTHSAIVLGHSAGETTETLRAFKDMGFDSLTAVALRNSIAAATGISLPATVLFDYPTPAALSQLLRDELCSGPMTTLAPVLTDLDSLETALLGISHSDSARTVITARLQRIMSMWHDSTLIEENSDVASRIQTATTSEVLEFIDQQLGRAVN
ncbi:MAG: type I polyketide synthase, partial [Pseudonocardiaceae bacterium]